MSVLLRWSMTKPYITLESQNLICQKIGQYNLLAIIIFVILREPLLSLRKIITVSENNDKNRIVKRKIITVSENNDKNCIVKINGSHFKKVSKVGGAGWFGALREILSM